VIVPLLLAATLPAATPAKPFIDKDVVFEEVDGVVAVEAEHFFQQDKTETRAWYLTTAKHTPQVRPDGDENHAAGAGGGAYLEVLPDTRRTHGDPMNKGENFSNEPGKLAILRYKVHFNNPGRYYVWARIYSTGTEDNGLHVGIDGTWPESGQRMQWTAKRQWAWGSKQRTEQVHSGVKHKLYLDIEKAGPHVIQFSMREDGTEFDKWMMVREKLDSVRGTGPAPKLKRGKLPEAPPAGEQTGKYGRFNPKKDLLSLHYDHAPDKDDGHSAAADRTILETLFGKDWLTEHVQAVSGAYGKNAHAFNDKSDAVMQTVWGPRGGWIDAHEDRDKALKQVVKRWAETLQAGGDVWVKEGGQSDLTADAVRALKQKLPEVDLSKRIHVVQHSSWNEGSTTKQDLAYVKKATDYIRIRDANRFLNVRGGHDAFEKAALAHPVFGASWKAAFAYYDPDHRLDFSDTGELMHILDLGEIGLDAFVQRFLERKDSK
jgi:hypothetical protein